MIVGIAGIGGIGSNVARYLAQSGVRRVRIVDFDCVEKSNLNRQFYTLSQVGRKKTVCLKENLLAIYKEMEVETVDRRLGRGDIGSVFADCPIVVEGFDEKVLKKMLVEELAASGKVVVSASGISGKDMDTVRVRKVGNCHIVGDFVSDHTACHLFPPKIGLVAATMAGIVLQQMGGAER